MGKKKTVENNEPAPPKIPTFDGKKLAYALDMKQQSVNSFMKDGRNPPPARGKSRYGLETVRWYVQQLKERSARNTNTRELVEQEKLRQLKRENDIAERLLVPTEDLGEALDQICSSVIPILENIPLDLKRRWPEITGDQVQLIKASIAEARNAVAAVKVKAT